MLFVRYILRIKWKHRSIYLFSLEEPIYTISIPIEQGTAGLTYLIQMVQVYMPPLIFVHVILTSQSQSLKPRTVYANLTQSTHPSKPLSIYLSIYLSIIYHSCDPLIVRSPLPTPTVGLRPARHKVPNSSHRKVPWPPCQAPKRAACNMFCW